MDQQVNRRASGRPPEEPPAEIVGMSAPRQTFAEQLAAFLRRNLYWFLTAGFVLLLLQDIFGTHGVLAMRRSQAEARKIQQEINQLDGENQKLQGHVKDLKTDPATIECIAREDIGLARPGELIFKTQPSAPDPAHPATQPCSSQKP
ncbi:MAG: septum formation initiator family protein [Candidatus Acidiferrales bacterium]